jgi:cytochrome c oxidase cbb3-type subunit 2
MPTTFLKSSLFLSAAAGLLLSVASFAQISQYQEEQQMNMQSHIGNLHGTAERGAHLYKRFCIGCHGVIGDGEGENAQWIDPKPRNFTLGVFKCRSTPTGTLPLDSDIYNSIGRGLTNSNMPHWLPLTDQDRADLTAYVKHFSPRFVSEKPGEAIQIPKEPEPTPERIKNGQAIFKKVECWKCHGVEGRANGPSSDTLTDDLGKPIKPFNFHDNVKFKCGSSDQDMYRDFMTGLDGTPMPSFVDNIKPDEAWDLVFYLRSLQPAAPINRKEKQIAQQLGLKPVNPNAPAQQSDNNQQK